MVLLVLLGLVVLGLAVLGLAEDVLGILVAVVLLILLGLAVLGLAVLCFGLEDFLQRVVMASFSWP